MHFVLWVTLGLALLAVLNWWGSRRIVHRRIPLLGLRRFVWSLLYQMAPGGFFIAERHEGQGFLQLALREVQGDSYTVEFGLPEVAWSVDSFGAVLDALRSHGFDPDLETGTGQVNRFMRVVFDGSETTVIERAMTLFAVTTRTMRWAGDTTFDVRFGGDLDIARARGRLAAARRRGA